MFSWLQQMGKKRRRGGTREEPQLFDIPKSSHALPVIIVIICGLVIWAAYSQHSRSHRPSILQHRPGGQQQSAASRGEVRRKASSQPNLYGYRIVRELPHQQDAFTQGLEFERRCAPKSADGKAAQCRDILWESTGMNGASTVREVDLETGKTLRQRKMAEMDFAEGLTKLNGRLYQLTWRSGKLYSYAADDFKDVVELRTPLEDGWGIATDGSSLIVSDSSSTLYWLDPKTLAEQRRVVVRDGEQEVPWVNELEWVDGEIWGNVWQSECIARIDAATGAVRGWIMLNGLTSHARSARDGGHMDVLNGIAWDAVGKRLFVTGKWWPKLFEVALSQLKGRRANAAAIEQARKRCIPRDTNVF